MKSLTVSQREALLWLQRHNGEGIFDVNGVLIAAGEAAGFMRSTWNKLRDVGYLEYIEQVKGRPRVRLTDAGRGVRFARKLLYGANGVAIGYDEKDG